MAIPDRVKSPVGAAGLDLVEFRCSDCGSRWWVERQLAGEENTRECTHPVDDRRRTGYETHKLPPMPQQGPNVPAWAPRPAAVGQP